MLLQQLDARLGPFGGLPACTRIAWGKGVCGTAGTVAGVLDVDSPHLARFDDTDQRCLEEAVAILARQIDFNALRR